MDLINGKYQGEKITQTPPLLSCVRRKKETKKTAGARGREKTGQYRCQLFSSSYPGPQMAGTKEDVSESSSVTACVLIDNNTCAITGV